MRLNNNYYYYFNKEVFILMLLRFRLWVNAHFDKKATDVKRAAQKLDANKKQLTEQRLFAYVLNRVNDTVLSFTT